jgi:hypothetical protein
VDQPPRGSGLNRARNRGTSRLSPGYVCPQVRFHSGEKLDANDAFKLLESMQDIQNHPIPDRYKEV